MKWKRGEDKPYQTFWNRKGDSDSPGKLKTLKLPDLKGKSLLDLGCNEGFFCIEAKKRGATRVVGLDKRPAVIEAAKQRAPEIDFRCQTWDTLPEGVFDVILLLSALHYANDPQALLDRIYQALAPNGVLVLETGLSENTLMQWGQAQRGNGSVWYPSKLLLIQSLLKNFAVRRMGKSVDQRGDPFKRYVFHCRRFKPIVLLVTGEYKTGKSILAAEFQKHVIPTVRSDWFITIMARNEGHVSSDLYRFVQKTYQGSKINVLTQKLVKKGLHEAFVEELVRSLPSGERMIVLEGYSLGQPEIKAALIKVLVKKGFVVWNTERCEG